MEEREGEGEKRKERGGGDNNQIDIILYSKSLGHVNLPSLTEVSIRNYGNRGSAVCLLLRLQCHCWLVDMT